MSPWWIFNYHRYHYFVHLDLEGCVVLFMGNNPAALGTSGEGSKFSDAFAPRFMKIANPVKRDQARRKEAFNFIKNHPTDIPCDSRHRILNYS